MKIDPHKNKERFLRWKSKYNCSLDERIGPNNGEILLRYLGDMETGMNVSKDSKKGPRSFGRLVSIKDKCYLIFKKIKELYGLEKITEVSEEQIHSLFFKMRNGEILRNDGRQYMAVGDYVKTFKAFWHWHQKVSRKQGIIVEDITCDLDASQEKPKWVYLNDEEIQKLCDNVKFKYKVLIMFILDSGIRAPTELINIKVSDLSEDFSKLNIRSEISKTFGRKINLLRCRDLLRKYVNSNNLGNEDYLFKICAPVVNRYLKRACTKLFGDSKTQAGKKYSEIKMYDLRHISCCYWVTKYTKEREVMYRFGWSRSEKINYYSEFIGMRDNISEEDLLVGTDKTEFERKLEKSEMDNNLLQERINSMESQMSKILELVDGLYEQV
jgi:integrase